MQADFWHQRWEHQQIGFHQAEFNSHLQAFWGQIHAPVGSQIFVPLCGKSRDMLWLRSQDLRVMGVEISPIAVRDFFAENGLEPTVTQQGAFERWECDGLVILQGDFFDLSAADVVNCAGVFDRASLIALPLEMRVQYAHHFMAILPHHIQTLLITLEYEQSEMRGPPFSVQEAEVHGFYAANYTVERLLAFNALDDEPSFRQRGLTRLDEKVYVLTPHPCEAARLLASDTPSIEHDRIAVARRLQHEYGGVIVLKGAGTLIASTQGIAICPAGNPGMASGGMGDVLTGIITALLAQGLGLVEAAETGVWLHAHAADLAAVNGERGLLASDLIAHLREALNT